MLDTEEVKADKPSGPQLTAEDLDELERLPLNVALEHINKRHYNEQCGHCSRFIGNHSLKQMKKCFQHNKGKSDEG